MKKIKQTIHHLFHKIDDVLFGAPYLWLSIILAMTVFFAVQIPGVKMYSEFADLLPQEHPYIKTHNEIRDDFGGANNIILAVEVENGDIFTNETVGVIHQLTEDVDKLPGVNHNLVSSVTHRTVRKVWLTQTGDVNSAPHYDPLKKEMSEAELAQMRQDVMSNPRVYGLLVSPDLKAGLIKATFNEGALDYQAIFAGVQTIREAAARSGIEIHATGAPMLVGWVFTYVGQILQIFFFTLLVMVSLLILYFRRLYGIVLPLLGILMATIWGLGTISLLGYNLDPLTLVIPFLISARAMSHGIQIVERYYEQLEVVDNTRIAARNTFNSLFRPGSLGVVSDAIGLLLIALGSVPINTKMAHYASLWAFSVIFVVLIFMPLMLAVLPRPRAVRKKDSRLAGWMDSFAASVSTRRSAITVLCLIVLMMACGGYFSSWVQIGEAESGSPLLYQDHDYNVSSKAVNQKFPGSEELFILARTDKPGGIKRPEVLRALEDLERHMLLDPELGGVKAVPGLVKQVNRIFHSNDPRWSQIPDSDSYVGGLLFAYMASSPIPGAEKEFIDTEQQTANMVFYYKDHKGGTIRRAIHQIKQWIGETGSKVEGLSFRLAGGQIGVTAAINEAAYSTNMLVIPLVLGLIFLFVTLFYSSLHAGLLMMCSMAFATTLTYAYMGIKGIGINVNTVPIIAVGIGIGIDYSIYVMDRIREEIGAGLNLNGAIRRTFATTGKAVGFTAATLIGGIIMWVFISDLRFQADAALLLCVMLILNAMAAIFLVPSWVLIFRPNFIVKALYDKDDILIVDGADSTPQDPSQLKPAYPSVAYANKAGTPD
jgi:predicted RND superfamily exporter protein